MNISKNEQRVLHALAQGGLTKVIKDDKNRILEADCITRDGLLSVRAELSQR